MSNSIGRLLNGRKHFKSRRALLGPDASYDVFDAVIKIHINTALSVFTQLGIGLAERFMIIGSGETLGDFIGNDKTLNIVKTYVYMKVKKALDPPVNSSVLSAYQEACKE